MTAKNRSCRLSLQHPDHPRTARYQQGDYVVLIEKCNLQTTVHRFAKLNRTNIASNSSLEAQNAAKSPSNRKTLKSPSPSLYMYCAPSPSCSSISIARPANRINIHSIHGSAISHEEVSVHRYGVGWGIWSHSPHFASRSSRSSTNHVRVGQMVASPR